MTRPMRVLVIAYDFPPHAAIGTMRTLRVVRELAARGADVKVLTGDPRAFRPGTPVDAALLRQVPDAVEILRATPVRPWERAQATLGAPFRRSTPRAAAAAPAREGAARPDRSARGRTGPMAGLRAAKDTIDAALAIPDRESGWLWPAIARGAARDVRAWQPDVIYSSAPPWTGQLVAWGVQRRLRCPWVADFRDPWARAPWRGDRYRFALAAAARLEQAVIRRADRVVFVAAANRQDFIAQYGPGFADRSDVVANGCDPTEFEALGPIAPSEHPFVLLHAGSLYAGRTPVPLFHAVRRALDDGRLAPGALRVRFLGQNGMPGADLPGVIRELGLGDVVELLPRVPREEGLRAMCAASALLLLQPGHAVSVPGKVYEYMAAGRPIFAIADEGETADVVRQSGTGVTVAADDPAVIADALVRFITRPAGPTGPPPRALYDGRVGAARIADILDGVAAHAPHAR